jgi:hypothetical protein
MIMEKIINLFVKLFAKLYCLSNKVELIQLEDGRKINLIWINSKKLCASKSKKAQSMFFLSANAGGAATFPFLGNSRWTCVFIDENVPDDMKEPLLYHEIGHIINGDIEKFLAASKESKKDKNQVQLMLDMDCEKKADLYSFNHTGVKITPRKLAGVLVDVFKDTKDCDGNNVIVVDEEAYYESIKMIHQGRFDPED